MSILIDTKHIKIYIYINIYNIQTDFEKKTIIENCM